MKIITKKMLIKDVAIAWRNQYPVGCESDKEKIFQALLKLPENATEKMVEKTIGNSSWTENLCEECGKKAQVTITLLDKSRVMAHSTKICKPCIKKANRLLTNLPKISGKGKRG